MASLSADRRLISAIQNKLIDAGTDRRLRSPAGNMQLNIWQTAGRTLPEIVQFPLEKSLFHMGMSYFTENQKVPVVARYSPYSGNLCLS